MEVKTIPIVYMDLCALKRPLDEPREGRVRLEAEADIVLLELEEEGRIHLIRSSVLEAENRRNPLRARRERAGKTMTEWKRQATITPSAIKKARSLLKKGIRPADALHAAVAIEARADVFVTTDGKLERKLNRMRLPIRVVNPIVFAEEVSHGPD